MLCEACSKFCERFLAWGRGGEKGDKGGGEGRGGEKGDKDGGRGEGGQSWREGRGEGGQRWREGRGGEGRGEGGQRWRGGEGRRGTKVEGGEGRGGSSSNYCFKVPIHPMMGMSGVGAPIVLLIRRSGWAIK